MANWQDIPDGVYRARAREGALTTSKTDKPMLVVTFEIVDDGEWKGACMTWRGFFTEKTTDRTFESLRYCGWRGDDINNLDGIKDNEVELDIKREKYKEKWEPKIQWVNKPGTIKAGAPMAADRATAFAAAMRRAAEASRVKTGAGSAPAGNVPSFS